jgi:hypothetical protein
MAEVELCLVWHGLAGNEQRIVKSPLHPFTAYPVLQQLTVGHGNVSFSTVDHSSYVQRLFVKPIHPLEHTFVIFNISLFFSPLVFKESREAFLDAREWLEKRLPRVISDQTHLCLNLCPIPRDMQG